MKYRKKPVVIDAIHNTGANLKDVETFLAGKVMPDFYIGPIEWGINWGNGAVELRTLEGTMIANPGDWIIRGVKGELYPCKADIFEATYEPYDMSQNEAGSAKCEHDWFESYCVKCGACK